MNDTLRLPAPDGEPAHRNDEAPARRVRACCEFCECELAPDGSVMRMSDKARSLRDQGEAIERHKATIAQLETDLSAARRELADRTTPAVASVERHTLTL